MSAPSSPCFQARRPRVQPLIYALFDFNQRPHRAPIKAGKMARAKARADTLGRFFDFVMDSGQVKARSDPVRPAITHAHVKPLSAREISPSLLLQAS